LGVGIIYWPELLEPLDLLRQELDVLEVEPQPFWLPDDSSPSGYALDHRAFAHLRQLPHPKLVHGVGFPVGGTVSPTSEELDAFVASIREIDAVWASEHLSFTRVVDGDQVHDLGFLLPPLQTQRGVAACIENIVRVQASLPVPFAVETGVNYLQPRPGELTDGLFFSSVVVGADCGLLLDVHNLWANQCNGRQAVLDVVAELPLDRVVELHLAGGQEFDGYWVDAHSGLVPDEVLNLAWQIVPRLPNLKAIIYEVMPEYVAELGITAQQLRTQLKELHGLWESRGGSASTPASSPPGGGRSTPEFDASPTEWERAVAAALSPSLVVSGQSVLDLSDDPGIPVLRSLIGGVRAGKVASTMTLSTRFLLLSLGEAGTQALFEEFWARKHPQAAASAEAESFASFVLDHPACVTIEGLGDVVRFELAAHQAVLTGHSQRVVLSIDPAALQDLREGRRPRLRHGVFDVTVTGPATGRSAGQSRAVPAVVP
jgi:uncharacterized protein (UPF0276 family)